MKFIKTASLFLFSIYFSNAHAGNYDALSISAGKYRHSVLNQAVNRITDVDTSCSGTLFISCSSTYYAEHTPMSVHNFNTLTINYEHRFRGKLAFEAGILYGTGTYKLMPELSSPIAGGMKRQAILIGLKYYLFRNSENSPYFGLGVHAINTEFKTPISNDISSFARSINTGYSMVMGEFKYYLQYSYFKADSGKMELDDYPGDRIGHYVGNLDMSGQVLNMGFAWIF